jgi:hypothetical protein
MTPPHPVCTVKGVTVQVTENGVIRSNLVIALLWLNFIALWVRVYSITTITDVRDSITYIGHFGVAYSVLVTLWILHNIRIFRHKGPRLGQRLIPFAGTQDSLNQPIYEAAGVRRDQEIVVEVIQGRKFFLHGSGSPNDPLLTTVRG